MSTSTKVAIAGGGWPGLKHAEGFRAAGGFQVVAVADPIDDRRAKLKAASAAAADFTSAEQLMIDRSVELVSLCVPTHLHTPLALAALKAGKHVLLESPPATSVKEARQIQSAAAKRGKQIFYALQRRFGGSELAAKQTIDKGYAGDVYHARVAWTRTRGVPAGTGWYGKREQSGGGAMIDLGLPLIDLAWFLLGRPMPKTVMAMTHAKHAKDGDVEDAAFALLGFEGGKSIEVACAWAINQPPHQNGTSCRVYGDAGAIDVYTPHGATLYRNFDAKGNSKATPLTPPKVSGHAAMMRHVRQCLIGKATPSIDAAEGVILMQMIEALYRSAETGKSVEVKTLVPSPGTPGEG